VKIDLALILLNSTRSIMMITGTILPEEENNTKVEVRIIAKIITTRRISIKNLEETIRKNGIKYLMRIISLKSILKCMNKMMIYLMK
jgi:hypothetical protein